MNLPTYIDWGINEKVALVVATVLPVLGSKLLPKSWLSDFTLQLLLWVFQEAHTPQQNMLHRASRLTRPAAKLRLTMGASEATKRTFWDYLNARGLTV